MFCAMAQGHPIGERVRKLREERGLSAFAVSKRAGLGVNYVRQLERGGKHPDPQKLAALARALELDSTTLAELRRLAAIDPDPAVTPEAKAARRAAWPLLLYVLVNHVLLPRLELPDILDARRGQRNAELVDLVRRAAVARTQRDFERDVAGLKPPRSVVNLIEKHFGKLPPSDLASAQSDLSLNDQLLDLVAVPTARLGDGDLDTPYELAELAARLHSFSHGAATGLLPHVSVQAVDMGQASLQLRKFGLDWNFAVALFPFLYWHVCRYWPFEKVINPLARLGVDQQRHLYDAVQRGLDLVDFDRALLGEGKLGRNLRAAGTTRPPFYGDSDTVKTGHARIPIERPLPDIIPQFYDGPVPPVDVLCDELDRNELLARFPLIKIDTAGFDELVHERTLPSWGVWVACVRERMADLTPDAPPLGPRKFGAVLSYWSLGLGTGAADRAAGSPTLHRLADHLRASAWLKLHQGKWSDVLAAAEILDARGRWLRWLQAVARRSAPEQPDDPR
ncbi:MAG TPA: helix-turn-helix transcriptional regulator [Phycisphaerae bacterium]|nr:helix-turn-helix transcriptional regulator [Phycisphaerae bacterium]